MNEIISDEEWNEYQEKVKNGEIKKVELQHRQKTKEELQASIRKSLSQLKINYPEYFKAVKEATKDPEDSGATAYAEYLERN